jgi:glycosyltransferase involved in cell wall biosynthesis
MRIAVFQLDNFQQSPFGKYFVKLARELQSRGIDVDLLATSALGFDSIPEGTGAVLVGQNAGALPSHFQGIGDLTRYFRAKSPDAIIANGPAFAIAASLAKWISRSPVKIIFYLHSPLSHEIRNRTHRSALIWPIILLPILFSVHRVVAVSNGVAKDYSALTHFPLSKIDIQSWAMITDIDIKPECDANSPHPWLVRPRLFKTVIAAGRLAPEKNYSLLIETIAQSDSNLRCLILGDGPMHAELQNLISNRGLSESIQLVGRVERPESYFRKADLFALTSTFEGSPVVIIEALQAGLPVVATACGGPSELLENGKYGRLVPPNDLPALVKAIREELDTPRDAALLKKRAADFHVSKAADHFLEIIYGRSNP